MNELKVFDYENQIIELTISILIFGVIFYIFAFQNL